MCLLYIASGIIRNCFLFVLFFDKKKHVALWTNKTKCVVRNLIFRGRTDGIKIRKYAMYFNQRKNIIPLCYLILFWVNGLQWYTGNAMPNILAKRIWYLAHLSIISTRDGFRWIVFLLWNINHFGWPKFVWLRSFDGLFGNIIELLKRRNRNEYTASGHKHDVSYNKVVKNLTKKLIFRSKNCKKILQNSSQTA